MAKKKPKPDPVTTPASLPVPAAPRLPTLSELVEEHVRALGFNVEGLEWRLQPGECPSADAVVTVYVKRSQLRR